MCIPIQWKSWKVLSEANVQRAWQRRNIFVIAALLGIGHVLRWLNTHVYVPLDFRLLV